MPGRTRTCVSAFGELCPSAERRAHRGAVHVGRARTPQLYSRCHRSQVNWYPWGESNSRLRFRRPALLHLSYRGAVVFRDPENEEPPGLADRGFVEKWAFRLYYSWTSRSVVSVRPSCVPHTNPPAAGFFLATRHVGWVGMKVCMIRSYVPQCGSLRQETILVFLAEGEGVESLSLLLTRQASVPEATLGPMGPLVFETSVLRRRAHPFRDGGQPRSRTGPFASSARRSSPRELDGRVAEGGGVEPRARRSSR